MQKCAKGGSAPKDVLFTLYSRTSLGAGYGRGEGYGTARFYVALVCRRLLAAILASRSLHSSCTGNAVGVVVCVLTACLSRRSFAPLAWLAHSLLRRRSDRPCGVACPGCLPPRGGVQSAKQGIPPVADFASITWECRRGFSSHLGRFRRVKIFHIEMLRKKKLSLLI